MQPRLCYFKLNPFLLYNNVNIIKSVLLLFYSSKKYTIQKEILNETFSAKFSMISLISPHDITKNNFLLFIHKITFTIIDISSFQLQKILKYRFIRLKAHKSLCAYIKITRICSALIISTANKLLIKKLMIL